MPANVTIDYAKAKKKYDDASTPLEKLVALQEMRSTAPKHKGAEKLRAEISKKIAQVKREIEKQKAIAKKKGSAPSMHVKKEGAGQVVIVGTPNSGKSTLLQKLTGIDVEIAPYPFTTKKPVSGMLNYNGAKVQVVEVPAIIKGSSGGKAEGTQILSVIRNADAVIVAEREAGESKTVFRELEKAKILLNRQKPRIRVEPTKFKGINLAGKKYLKVKEEDVIGFLKEMGYHNANVIIGEKIENLEKVAEALDESNVYKKALVLDVMEIEDLDEAKKKVFGLLGKILVYTKKPGGKVDMNEPLVLKKDSTVESVAEQVHKDFARKLKYVRVWGSTKFPGQRVSKKYRLKDNDVIEIYS